MKLVLKYNQTIKLYTEEIKQEQILKFISAEMGLQQQSVEITYTDQDGDQIYLKDDNDLEILTTLVNDKAYVKINVKAEIKKTEVKSSHLIGIDHNFSSNNLESVIEKTKSQEKAVLIDHQVEESIHKQIKSDKKSKKKKNQQVKKKEKKEKAREQPKKEHKELKKSEKKQETEMPEAKDFKKFSKIMSQTINGIVSQRLQALVQSNFRIVREKNQQKKQKGKIPIDQGFQCKNCLATYNIGIRYECPKCFKFSICQKCEQSLFHEHNLLKIRRREEQINLNQKTIKNNLKKLYTLLKPQKAQNEKKHSPIEDQKIAKICKQLKQIFGGRPQNYASFVQKYQNLQFNLLLEKYCEENNIKLEEGREKYIDALCGKLAKLNKIQPEHLKIFVKENLKMGYEGLAKFYKKQNTIIESPLQAQISSSPKEEVKIQIEPSKEPQMLKQSIKLGQIEPQIQQDKKEEIVNRKDQVLENLQMSNIRDIKVVKKDKQQKICRYEMTQQKLQIFDLMIQFYGDERADQYHQFIEEHYKQGKENIIMQWYSNISVMECQK